MAPIPKVNIALDDVAIELITRGQFEKEMRMTTRTHTVPRLALATVAGVISLLANDNLSSTRESSLITQAGAQVGSPLTPGSVAGVARRADRRAVRRDAVVGGAAVGATAYYGAGGFGAFGAASTEDYGPGPVPGSFIVNPNTGRWCRFEESGRRWCWTP